MLLHQCYNPLWSPLLFYHILKPTCYFDFHLYKAETPRIGLNINWEMFMILLRRNAAWGEICFLILQVSPQMTVSYEIQTKSNVSYWSLSNRLYNCYDHGAVGK